MSVDRLVLMTWCPEQAKIKQKMLYSSSYDALKKVLMGVYKYVQACDFEDVISNEAKTVYEEVKKDKKYRYIIYHIKDERVIDVETTAERSATYADFLEQLQNYKNDKFGHTLGKFRGTRRPF
ncbi:hypothetical protein HPB52_019730 [Rhipicephalus sanguineus]|uniref:ADF-H domain-containing protein n=1 Tax=Rhipicephalus sanguineus TaxID=34632 RepID=A0A9D4Q2E1_RHISA|nr:hypothetical protein HPB52_019730 [Rhipicephalus sanguineus]